jgi:hypothetical protein
MTVQLSPRVVAHASDLEPGNKHCTCCERPLKGKFAWLELDQRTDTFHDFGGVPDGQSQGWFPLGMTCARKKLAAARVAIGNPS